MVPKVAAKGRSFRGAGLYYLHDKKAKTAERVAFTLTENLPTNNPETALKIMAHTAMHQAELKAATGQAKTGRKLTQPVYTYSLSWHPDEAPTREQMIEAARETLKVLGLERHEVILVAHNDEPHSHIHVIVNRVDPETGKAATLSNDLLQLSKWAEAYEKRHGKIFCEQRVENNERRRKGEFVKDGRNLSRAEYTRWQRNRLKELYLSRKEEEAKLSAAHRAQRKTLYDAKEARIAEQRKRITEALRPEWADLYARQRHEADELRQAQHSAFSRLTWWIRTQAMDRWSGSQMERRGMLRGALEAVLGRQDFAAEMRERHERERKGLAAEVNGYSRTIIDRENERYRGELETLAHEQGEETQTLREAHREQTQTLAREIKDGTAYEQFVAEQPSTLTDEFRKQFAEELAKIEEKRAIERERNTGREREE